MKEKLLPEKLKELRKLHNYSQYDVAAAIGVVRQTYSHYELGRITPSAATIYKLAGFYKIPVEDLMQLTVKLDRNIYYDAPNPTNSGNELSEFLAYCDKPDIIKKFKNLDIVEKELLYYFDKISDEDKREIIEFTKIKAKKMK